MPQLDRLGLRENPFKNNVDQRYFYADQNRTQIIESTEHLIEYSSNFQVIIGESGMGKSHLLEVLANRIDNNWRVAKISDAEQYDTISLIQAILDSFAAKHDVHAELLESLENQLAEINQLGFKPVLLVDSAQSLSIDSLRFLIQLSQQKQDEEPYINIVLLSTNDVIEHLQSQELKDFRDIIHITTLNHLDKEGVSAYLRHKMAVAGFDRESPFTPRIIDSIFNDSKGVPEKVDFFADKFLASSGKAENYIEVDNHQQFENSALKNNPINNLNDDQEKKLFSSLDDNDLSEHRSDRAEEQLNRLTEQFEKIEQLGNEPSEDELLNKTISDENEPPESGLPKFVIPVAVIGILIVALIVINNVFDQSEQNEAAVKKEEIELLPLELPPEISTAKEKMPDKILAQSVQQEKEQINQQELPHSIENNPDELNNNTKTAAELELIELNDSKLQKNEPSQLKPNEQADTLVVEQKAQDITDSATTSIIPAPELSLVEPEPVIGSNRRQNITFIGNNLKKDTRLIVMWADNKKEFSEQQTPKQWQYINKNKIKLHLSTGIQTQPWQVFAKNADNVQSKTISFDVVKPFISKIKIKNVSPNPFIGSDKRQAISIEGKGFSKQTVMELRWDKNKKHFSSRLTPNQFEYINSNQIKLFIATGIKKRKWTVVAISPTGNTSTSSFSVVNKSAKSKKNVKSSSDSRIKDEIWLKQQADTNYTIQLFGSYNKNAIDELVKKYSLEGDILRYSTRRNGQNWYTMTYGNYKSKENAEAAIATLAPALTKTPWVRNFASIKDQLSAPAANQSTSLPDSDILKTVVKPKNEAWIWTQNPADYTVQLIALSTEAGIKDFINKHAIQSKSAYFKKVSDGKTLYVLIYGRYPNNSAAQQAGKQLQAVIKESKPWVRNFSAIHGMMQR